MSRAGRLPRELRRSPSRIEHMLRRTALGLALAAAWQMSPPAAAAHGPCSCTWPVVVSPGGALRTGSGYKAIWNPRPADFANQTTPIELASGHRPGAPTRTVLQGSRSHPRRRMVVRVPRATPPGIYVVLVFDGSEAGWHTTLGLRAGAGPPRGRPRQRHDGTAAESRDGAPQLGARSRDRDHRRHGRRPRRQRADTRPGTPAQALVSTRSLPQAASSAPRLTVPSAPSACRRSILPVMAVSIDGPVVSFLGESWEIPESRRSQRLTGLRGGRDSTRAAIPACVSRP
jgi:hypothetical protein